MSERSFKKPGRVEQARLRLDAAIDRLERALAERADGDVSVVPPKADPGAIAELETLQRENARLRAANENVAERLDATIGRLEKLLNE